MRRGLDEKELGDLASDFRRWGRESALRIRRLTRKYGVLCSAHLYSDKKKG